MRGALPVPNAGDGKTEARTAAWPGTSDVTPTSTDGRAATAADMSVETVRYDATSALVRVTGELDLGTSAPLWAVLEGHHLAGRRFVRLDMSGVTFLDATALSGIVTAHEQLLAARGTLVITGVRSRVARVLQLTALEDRLFIGGPRADGDTEARFDLSDELAAAG